MSSVIPGSINFQRIEEKWQQIGNQSETSERWPITPLGPYSTYLLKKDAKGENLYLRDAERALAVLH